MRLFLFTLAASLAVTLPAFGDDAKNLGRFEVNDDETDLVHRRYYGGGYYRPSVSFYYGGGYGYGRSYSYGYSSYYAPRPYYYAPRVYYSTLRYYYGGGWYGIGDASAETTQLALRPVAAPATRSEPQPQRVQPAIPAPAPQRATPPQPVEDVKVSLPPTAMKSKYQYPAYGEKK